MDFNKDIDTDIDLVAIYSYVEDFPSFYDLSVSGDGCSVSHESWFVECDSTATNGYTITVVGMIVAL